MRLIYIYIYTVSIQQWHVAHHIKHLKTDIWWAFTLESHTFDPLVEQKHVCVYVWVCVYEPAIISDFSSRRDLIYTEGTAVFLQSICILRFVHCCAIILFVCLFPRFSNKKKRWNGTTFQGLGFFLCAVWFSTDVPDATVIPHTLLLH